MKFLRERVIGCVLTFALTVSLSPAFAVVIQDSLWRREGGGRGKEWAGFGANLRLAAEPQFRAVLALASDGETWGEASGTWIGNDGGHGYILTSAHIFELPASADSYVVRAPNGDILTADKVWLHPSWNGSTDERTGYDLAILRLTRPVSDAGPPPVLHTKGGEAGKLITFIGFGSRGIGSVGEKDRYYHGSDKAAAQGIVDQLVEPILPMPKKDDGGNYLGVWMGREDGSLSNPYGGSDNPANALIGLLGSGDSGGSAWMMSAGQWVVVAVNSNGSGTASYGDSSWFTRLAPHRDWIAKIFPGARFTP
ncbi:trypsin-like serine protease [Magnetospirillum sulfuroxidans]|uniref:Trypsin-like serine protease n=1 Tax=Magnetospirillum sulfuroxidans TaxID=611300 RepID=A0ABS5I7N8_9PROT|nr:trypsin-like serine protease [Magnetospirillum sulfuroxidans]MBR9970442.1 trypsin-like serine protease [Magnetospirillum sulfuroxidans]